jgi:hypothetical protein
LGHRPNWNVGILEYWKNDFWILECWLHGKIRVDDEIKIKMDEILKKATIPSFHYSIIP